MKKKDYLTRKVNEIFGSLKPGRVLDLGAGAGDLSIQLKNMGFSVTAADMDRERFQYHDAIDFRECHFSEPLPWADQIFDYVVLLEVIEHLENPFEVVAEISRVLRNRGQLILSTPNILNIGSRLRFLFEGSFDFFREPPLDYHPVFPAALQNMHIIAWRYHELEYMLFKKGLHVEEVCADHLKRGLQPLYWMLWPIIQRQYAQKQAKVWKKGGVSLERIHKIINSPDMLYGRHLILRSRKNIKVS